MDDKEAEWYDNLSTFAYDIINRDYENGDGPETHSLEDVWADLVENGIINDDGTVNADDFEAYMDLWDSPIWEISDDGYASILEGGS